MIVTAGIDAGAANTKAVLLDEEKRILSKVFLRSGSNFSRAAEEALSLALSEAGISREDISYTVSTGFGRYMVSFRDITATDVTAHAQGALYYFPETRSVLDIGAQSTRSSVIEPNGKVKVFRVNAKCAAGAGMFLTRAAGYLAVPIEDMGPLSLQSQQAVTISSVCAVLAESEIINQVTAGAKLEDIVKGLIVALVNQAMTICKRSGVHHPLTLTGGMARNIGIVSVIEEQLDHKINYSANGENGSYYAGALGASLLGLMRLKKLQAKS